MALYSDILPSEEETAELRRVIGDVFDPNNPARRLQYNVFQLPGSRCVKFGQQVYEREAMAMEYVRRKTTIPVPRVHAFFKSEDGKRGFIVMEYIEADAVLDDIQCQLSDNERGHYVRQINKYIQQLRRLGADGAEAMGSWQPQIPTEAAPYHNVFYKSLDELQPTAPFTTLEELKRHWAHRWTKRGDLGGPPEISIDGVSDKIVLTHGDLAARNILVKDRSIVAVLDWDSFGWYPSFWEYAFCRRGSLYAEWKRTFDEVFGPMTTPEKNFAMFIRKAFTIDA